MNKILGKDFVFSTTSECALELNNLLRTVPVEQLKHDIYTLLQKYVAFDSGMWIEGRPKNSSKKSDLIGGRLESTQAYGHSVMYFNQPTDRLVNYSSNVKHDPLFAAIIQNLGTAIRLDSIICREEFEKTDEYKNHCVPFNVQHAMSIAVPSPLSGIISFLSIFRANRGDYFSDKDEQLHQRLAPLLVSAYFTGIAISTGQFALGDANIVEEKAIVDDYGYIYAHSDNWHDSLSKIQQDSDSSKISKKIMQKVRVGSGSMLGYQLNAKLLDNDLYLCTLKPIPKRIQLLSSRQLQVAELYAQGYSRGDIAQKLNISEGTSSNHLVNIFDVLSINSKVELVRILQDG